MNSSTRFVERESVPQVIWNEVVEALEAWTTERLTVVDFVSGSMQAAQRQLDRNNSGGNALARALMQHALEELC